MRKINEIFYSLQGEGRHSGIPSVFLRFSGCNLRCSFCDTAHQEGIWLSDEDIVAEINKYPAPWIILTGGEPTLSIDDSFIAFLKAQTGKKIAIETNGTGRIPKNIDWVTVSPKIGMKGAEGCELKADRADELKVVDVGQKLEYYFSLTCVSAKTYMYLQPCFVSDEEECRRNMARTVGRVLADPRWTLSAQIHRFLEIP